MANAVWLSLVFLSPRTEHTAVSVRAENICHKYVDSVPILNWPAFIVARWPAAAATKPIITALNCQQQQLKSVLRIIGPLIRLSLILSTSLSLDRFSNRTPRHTVHAVQQ